jgi:hypothetical protein
MRHIRFQTKSVHSNMDRRKSKGWVKDPPAFIHPRIMFGNGVALEQADFVRKHEITHVINCAFDEDTAAWFRTAHPDKYAVINAVDDLNANILDWYPQFESHLTRFIQSEGSGTVYVHCQCGINRSGYLCVLYACKRLHYNYDDVVSSVLSQRPCALTNPNYRAQVSEACRTFTSQVQY